MRATLYYRGKLASCNYACPYCPFSKRVDDAATLALDQAQLERFIDWVEQQGLAGHQLSIFFNPYGEALTHRWYREGILKLSRMEHVERIAIQTNLSAKMEWTSHLEQGKLSIWATYHPGQIPEHAFLGRCQELLERDIAFSVGTVGVREAFEAIASMRKLLPREVYLWINAYKDRPAYYTAEERSWLSSIDPLFEYNLSDYESRGKYCKAGDEVFYVQGDGKVKRCYKDRQVIGDLYRDGLEGLAAPRLCRMEACDCYIGYIHLPGALPDGLYGSQKLERIAAERAFTLT
ncbi:STM4011 family radical SAM protein [Paenibacillus daejeonensis]|uniref:STM4011 family radical SAM protein n=1 Tax=Paenibacillus daejeonensis TaxID=135193 RepID=UPI00037F58FC|nr:STM4011 family radical SAM protein [Paenibacillus daejeonensis]